jgi:predicted nucleic acid-binding protein
MGKALHDARLAAVVFVHGIQNILTFNQADFRRYAGLAPVHPKELVAPAP